MRREDVVIATKVFFPMSKAPNGRGLSRKAIFTAIDKSLRRLGTDYVDLYQIHRWDYDADRGDAARRSRHRARGQGALSRRLLDVCLAIQQGAAPRPQNRLDAASSRMQNHYNLLYREEEREMMPLCADEGIGVLPWSPLARGRLTREWDTRPRRAPRPIITAMQALEPRPKPPIARSSSASARRRRSRGVPMAQVALAWVAQKPFVTAPIIGASKPQHLDDAVAALTSKLEPPPRSQLGGALHSARIGGQA
jgi:1-deoxyxylulose-5-phosphate synthase